MTFGLEPEWLYATTRLLTSLRGTHSEISAERFLYEFVPHQRRICFKELMNLGSARYGSYTVGVGTNRGVDLASRVFRTLIQNPQLEENIIQVDSLSSLRKLFKSIPYLNVLKFSQGCVFTVTRRSSLVN